MSNRYSANDLAFTLDGDFILGPGGDLLDTDLATLTDKYTGAKQAIAHRLMAEQNGWDLHPQLCAGLETFLGKSISPELTQAMESHIKYILTQDGLFQASNLIIKAVDIGAGTESVLIAIYIRGVSDKPISMLAFDIQTGHISQVL